VRVLNTVAEGSNLYQDGKIALLLAIGHYDQAVGDLTASIVAGRIFRVFELTLGLQFDQKMSQSQRQDEEFLKWLSPSYWLVEAQLSAARRQRASGTLQWIHNLDEIRSWQGKDASSQCQTLWVRGAPGVGKSTIAGYLVDYLKCGYPEAIVAYFFCKLGQTGLTSARDILRTITYQCLASGKLKDRSALEELKKTGFELENKMGINFLFERLLKNTIQAINQDIYVVIDGLDEAEYDVKDDIEPRPQLDVLLECLANMPRCRLLVVSRPPSDVLKIVPLATARSITIHDNRQDIETYVKRFVSNSERLQRHFKKTELDPVQYFVYKSDGIFLWVTLALQQLSNAKSRKIFETYLNGFSKAPGEMDKLYANVLSRMDTEDQRWAKEILKWILVSPNGLTIEELRGAVEKSMDDEHDDFKDFLEIQCGSFLRFVTLPDVVIVQLIHETFRTFLVDPTSPRPSGFSIDIDAWIPQVLLLCLDTLSTENLRETAFATYASASWVDHLVAVTTDRELTETLFIRLHHFFTSDAIRNWIMFSLCRVYESLGRLTVSVEEEALSKIVTWLAKTQSSGEASQFSLNDEELKESTIWRQKIFDGGSDVLGEQIGKAAARVWFDGDHQELIELSMAFRLALKYYMRRESRTLKQFQDLEQLAATDFKDMAVWGSTAADILPKTRNVGVAYFVLRRWEESIRFLRAPDRFNDGDFQTWIYLGAAYGSIGKYNEAINSFEKAIETYWSKLRNSGNSIPPALMYYCLGRVHRANGNPLGEFEAHKLGVEKGGLYSVFKSVYYWDDLFRRYLDHNNAEGAVKLYQTAVQTCPTELWPIYRLSEVYHFQGEFEEEIKCLNNLSEQARLSYPTDSDVEFLPNMLSLLQYSNCPFGVSSWLRLGWTITEAYKANSDYESAITTLQELRDRYPEESVVLKWIIETRIGASEAYKDKGEFDRAIEISANVVEFTPLEIFCIAEAHFANGDFKRTIELLRMSRASGLSVLQDFAEWLKRKGKLDSSGKFLKMVLEGQSWKQGILLVRFG
jgi:tetratricopeptide (TPR) repeat protein